MAKGASPDPSNPESYTAEDRIFLRAVLDMQCLRRDLLVSWLITDESTRRLRRQAEGNAILHSGKQLYIEPHTFAAGTTVRVELEATLGEEIMAQSQSYLKVCRLSIKCGMLLKPVVSPVFMMRGGGVFYNFF